MEISFSVLSIEDVAADKELIRQHLAAHPNFRYVGNATTLAEGKKLLASCRPDLLILDIDLPDGNSMEHLDEIRGLCDWPMRIVFHTVYDNYVIQAIRQQAFDYLIKPFLPEEMDAMLGRVEEDFRGHLMSDADGQRQTEALPELIAKQNNDLSSTVVMVASDEGFCRIDLSKVVYFEHIPKSKYWRMYMPDGMSYTLRKESSNADILPMSPKFVQVNQGAIINLDYLALLKRETVKLLPPYEKVQIVVSRNFLPGLQSRLLFI